MTISQAISALDSYKPNTYTQDEKISWLSAMDGMIKLNVIDTHEDGENVEFTGYDGETDTDTELLVGAPYEELYILWMAAKADFYNEEYDKYNNTITRFNDLYQDFANYYNRTHMSKGTAFKYF